MYNQGKCYRRKLVQVFVLAREAGNLPTRLGVTATRKTGNAVIRNRCKRLGREVFRLALPELRGGFTIIVNFSRDAASTNYDGLNRQLRSAWREAGILQNQTEVHNDRAVTGAAD